MIAQSLDVLAAVWAEAKDDKSETEDRWNKRTVQYIIKNPRTLRSKIITQAKAMKHPNVQEFDADDIYSMLVEYFAKCADYDPTYENSRGDGMVSFDAYISSGVRNCIKRFYSSNNTGTVSLNSKVYDGANSEGDAELGDLIPDQSAVSEFEAIEYCLEDELRSCRYLRGRFGCDLYTLIYVLLQTNGKDALRQDIFNILGYTNIMINRFSDETSRPESDLSVLMQAIAYFFNKEGPDYVLNLLREYVPDVDRLDMALRNGANTQGI